MLDALKRVAKNASKLNSDKILKTIFNNSDVKKFVSDLQKSQMYDKGLDSEGVTLGDYSQVSVTKFGKRPGHIRMYDTGEFFKSIKIKSETSTVIISADTIKQAWDGAIDLLDRWANLLGLNEESLSELREFIKPLFIEQVKQNIFA